MQHGLQIAVGIVLDVGMRELLVGGQSPTTTAEQVKTRIEYDVGTVLDHPK